MLLAAGGAVVVLLVALLVGVAVSRGDDDPGPTASSDSGASSDDPTAGAPSGSASTGTPSKRPSSRGPGSAGDGSGAPGAGETPRRPRRVEVALDAPGKASPQVTVRGARYEWVEGKTFVAGERGGPSIRVTLVARNSGDRAVRMPTALVNLYYGDDDTPAPPLMEPGGEPFPATIPARGTARGRFVFQMPQREGVPIRVEVILDNELVEVNFVGRPATVL